MTPILVSQPFGIGDIIFTQTLVRAVADGQPVIWPVEPYYAEGLNRAYPGIAFVDKDVVNPALLEVKQIRPDLMPIRWSDVIMQVPYTQVMTSKYDMYRMDWRDWRKEAVFVRNWQKEEQLREFLGIRNGEQYNFINNNFLRGAMMRTDIQVDNGLRNVEMKIIDSFSLFDWWGVVEDATNIFTVSTSLLYLIELLPVKAKEIHLYERKNFEPGFDLIKFLLTKDYILH
jgi:hypothetical protein